MLINKPTEVQALILLWAVAFYSLWNKLMSLIVSLISLVIHSFNSSSYLSSPWRLALAFLKKHEHMLTLWLLFSVENSYFFHYALSAMAEIAIYISRDAVLDISIFWWLLGGVVLVIDVLLFWFFFLEFQTGTLSLHYFHCSFFPSNSSCTHLTRSWIHDPFSLIIIVICSSLPSEHIKCCLNAYVFWADHLRLNNLSSGSFLEKTDSLISHNLFIRDGTLWNFPIYIGTSAVVIIMQVMLGRPYCWNFMGAAYCCAYQILPCSKWSSGLTINDF